MKPPSSTSGARSAIAVTSATRATEGAPAAGFADVIVDITTTGSTLRANHLKVLADGVILRSEACLVRSLRERSTADAALAAEISSAIARSVRG